MVRAEMSEKANGCRQKGTGYVDFISFYPGGRFYAAG